MLCFERRWYAYKIITLGIEEGVQWLLEIIAS
jgi:hypothetical protein